MVHVNGNPPVNLHSKTSKSHPDPLKIGCKHDSNYNKYFFNNRKQTLKKHFIEDLEENQIAKMSL
jgi:hypothetical protein